jgi:hypothetical protein
MMPDTAFRFSPPDEPHVELLPEHGIVLIINATKAEDTANFVDRFQEVWNQIPPRDRELILEFWRHHRQGPIIEICEQWMYRDSEMAVTSMRGFRNAFQAEIILNLALDWGGGGAAKDIIAHELAHVYQYANDSMEWLEESDEIESDAEAIAASWGFDGSELNSIYPGTLGGARD